MASMFKESPHKPGLNPGNIQAHFYVCQTNTTFWRRFRIWEEDELSTFAQGLKLLNSLALWLSLPRDCNITSITKVPWVDSFILKLMLQFVVFI